MLEMDIAKKGEICYNIPMSIKTIGGKKMDRITNSLMDRFSKDFELHIKKVETLFEYFTNFCAASNENGTDNLRIEELTTGNSSQGIDGIAVVVNGRFVYNVEDIKELLRLNKTLRVKFVLSQAKTSESFSNTEMLNFFHFVNVFFSEDTSVFTTEEMANFIELKNFIFDHAPELENNPTLVMYYFTTGVWQENDDANTTIDATRKALASLNLFSKIDVKMCGADDIQQLYRKTYTELTTTFKFEKRVTMYSVNENEIGYCGVIPFSEFSKIILDETGSLKAVFEDNIRDFLGMNTEVNKAIEETLKSENVNSFSMLNNGIMIVANASKLSGDILTLIDYQIVNGCQTSHVLYENMSKMSHVSDLMIPIRIIITQDENLKNSITKATNNQTSIKKEQLEALSTFQKKLEEYYKTYTEPEQLLYYERRSGQYRDSGIVKSRIVTIPMQIKTVTAMFLNNPHGVSGQYGTIAKNVGNKIFKSTDKGIIYYVSSMALYRIESLLKAGVIDKKYWKTRYHAMMLLRIIVSEEQMPNFNAKKMEQYCQKILGILNDSEKCKAYYSAIVKYIVEKSGLDLTNRKTFERKETTDVLLSQISDIKTYVVEELSLN